MPTWRLVLKARRQEVERAEAGLRRAVEEGDLDAADFARIWLGEAHLGVQQIVDRYPQAAQER